MRGSLRGCCTYCTPCGSCWVVVVLFCFVGVFCLFFPLHLSLPCSGGAVPLQVADLFGIGIGCDQLSSCVCGGRQDVAGSVSLSACTVDLWDL